LKKLVTKSSKGREVSTNRNCYYKRKKKNNQIKLKHLKGGKEALRGPEEREHFLKALQRGKRNVHKTNANEKVHKRKLTVALKGEVTWAGIPTWEKRK